MIYILIHCINKSITLKRTPSHTWKHYLAYAVCDLIFNIYHKLSIIYDYYYIYICIKLHVILFYSKSIYYDLVIVAVLCVV